ncbi:hypothetical protein D9M70_224610 [compost metagenome]
MSGLFRRLAAQASGQRGATLHAPARLPYQPAPERLAPVDPLPAAPAMLPPQPIAVRRPAPDVPLSSPVRRSPAAATTVAASVPAQPPQVIPEMAGDAPPPGSAPTPPALTWTVPAPLLGERPVAEAPRSLAEPPAPPSAPRSEPAAAPPPPAAHLDVLVVGPDVPPAPLRLPPALLPRAAAAAGRPAPALEARAEPAREPDEVHIHIGRIEVTALQEPAPARREARKGPPPLSLDDYLARRNGDGR